MTASVQLGKFSEKAPKSKFKTPSEDTYVIKLDDWDDPQPSRFIDEESGEYPLRIKLKFKIVKDLEGDDEFAGCDVTYWCGLDLNPKDKGSIWSVLTALDPANDPEPGMELDDYRGKTCKGLVTHSKPKVNADGETIIYANVTKVMPNKKPKPAATKPTNALLAEDDE